MKKIALIIILVLNLLCCRFGRRQEISNEYIEKLARGSFNVPSEYSFDVLFAQSENEKVLRSNVNVFRYIYDAEYKNEFEFFNIFLTAVLNRDILLPSALFSNQHAVVFSLDSRITEIYKTRNFDAFLKYYCIGIDSNNYRLKDISNDSLLMDTILYYVFVNGFKIRFVDSADNFIISKQDM